MGEAQARGSDDLVLATAYDVFVIVSKARLPRPITLVCRTILEQDMGKPMKMTPPFQLGCVIPPKVMFQDYSGGATWG